MNFLFHLGNVAPGRGKFTLEPIATNLAMQARALGHECVRDDEKFHVDPRVINVIFEGFIDDTMPSAMREARTRGGRFVIIAPEQPTDRGFNYGHVPEMIPRQDNFGAGAELAEAILYLVPGCGDWYGQFGVPAAHVETGYAPGLLRQRNPAYVPDIDYVFFGTETVRRKRVLKELRRAGEVLWIRDAPPDVLESQLARASVGVLVRPYDDSDLVSGTRAAMYLHCGLPVIGEPHELDGVWRDIVKFAPDQESFVQTALEMRALSKYAGPAQVERFKRILSPANCLGRALAEVGLRDVA